MCVRIPSLAEVEAGDLTQRFHGFGDLATIFEGAFHKHKHGYLMESLCVTLTIEDPYV